MKRRTRFASWSGRWACSCAVGLGLAALAGPAAVAPRPVLAAPSIDDLVLASVNGEEITRRMLVSRLLDYQGEDALQKMANRALVTQAAKRLALAVTDEDVDKRLVQIRTQFKTEEEFKNFLQRSGLTDKQHRDEVRFTLLLQKVALKETPVTDGDLQQFDIRMIVAPDKAAAEKLVQDLENGADFAKLATEKSTDPAGRRAGGRMAPFLRVEMIDVSKAIEEQKLIPGSFTRKPVSLGPESWAVVKLERLIPINLTSGAERDRLNTLMTRYRMDQWLAATRGKAEIQRKTFQDEVVATVNGEPVTRQQLAARLLEYQGEQTLNQMINRTLLLQAAKRLEVIVSDQEADKELAAFKSRFKNPEDFEAILTRNSLTEKQLRDELRYTVLMEKVALKETPISEEDLVRYEVRMLEAPSKTVAEKWVKDLEGGADFEGMVRERSVDPDGRESGGKVRPFLKVEGLEIWRALDAQKVKPGAYTKKPVLLADNSWVIIKLESRTDAVGEEKEKLREVVTNYRVNQWLNQTFSAAQAAGKVARPVPLTQAVIDGRPTN